MAPEGSTREAILAPGVNGVAGANGVAGGDGAPGTNGASGVESVGGIHGVNGSATGASAAVLGIAAVPVRPAAHTLPAFPFVPGVALRLPYPVRNVLRRWRGTIGMMVGVGIALGVSMTMLAVAQAAMDILTLDFRTSGANGYVLTEGGTLVPLLPSDTAGTIKRSRQVLSQLRRLPEVTQAVGVMTWSLERQHDAPRRADDRAELMATLGVDGDPTTIPGAFTLQSGRWIGRSDEVVIGPKLAREKALKLGDELRLSDRTFVVVGTGKLRGLGFGLAADSVVYMDHAALRQRADVGDVFSTIILLTRDPESVRAAVADLGSLSLFTPGDLVRQGEKAAGDKLVVYWVLIALTLAIASLFVSNMLGRSVAERRLEFATLRAIGIPTRTVLLTVVYEALLICLAAGGIGIVLSLGLGTLLNHTLAPAYSIESIYAARPSVFASVVGLALGLGAVAGVVPARQATRVDPVDVLREA